MSVTEKPKPPPVRRTRNFETWSWFFMRLSGLALVFLALVHFSVTHIINDVVETDANFVANRWQNPWWRIFDWLLLALALAHGLNGLRWIVGDYVRRPGLRRLVLGLIYGLSGSLFALGTFTIITF